MNGIHDLGGRDGLGGSGVLSEADLDDRIREVLATPRNANHHEPHREPIVIDPAVR